MLIDFNTVFPDAIKTQYFFQVSRYLILPGLNSLIGQFLVYAEPLLSELEMKVCALINPSYYRDFIKDLRDDKPSVDKREFKR